MLNSKLIALLRTFDKKDWIEASLFLKKSLGKEGRETVLFEYIKRYKYNLSSSKLRLEEVKNELPKNNESRSIRNILYLLTAQIEQYIVLKDLAEPENYFEYEVLLARAFKKRGLDSQFSSKVEAVKKKAEKSKTIDIWKNLHLTRLYYECYLSYIEDDSVIKEALLKPLLNIFEMFGDQFRLFSLAESVNIENFMGEEWAADLSSFLKMKEDNKGVAKTRLLELVYTSLKNKNEKSYLALKAEFLKQLDFLSPDLCFFVLVQLFNYNLQMIKKGQRKYSQDILIFYDIGLSSGVLLKNKKLSEKRFLNIIGYGCKFNKWTWTHNFRKNWSPYIETRHYNEVMALADANEAFAKKKYNDVIKILDNVKSYKKIDLSLRAKWLKLCSTYEIYGDGEESYDQISSFRVYLRRNKKDMSRETRKGSENLIKVVELMVKNEKKEKLIAFVRDCDVLSFRLWIDSKINNDG